MKLYKRFLTSFEMTINVLCWGMGVGWRLRRQPTPIPYKENVIICHSERSEESTVFTGQQCKPIKKRSPEIQMIAL